MKTATLVGLMGTLALAMAGCGGGTPESETPVDEYGVAVDDSDDMDEDYDEVDQPPVAKKNEDKEASGDEDKAPPPEPEFKEGMSVNEAINAVPPGIERVNIEDEVLARPLMDPKLYEPCKVSGKHFTIKVAIWDGHAVGMDIDAKDQKLAQCIRQQVSGVTWREKAKSLNTVEYSF